MPEGHVVHRVARDLNAGMAGDMVGAMSPQRSFAKGAARIDGRVLTRAEAWGKHLFVAFDDARDAMLHVHLGKDGKALLRTPDTKALTAARLRITGTRLAFDLVAPRICALVDEVAHDAVIAKLGPDPLRFSDDDGIDAEDTFVAALSTRATLGAALLDQSIVAGVGNVFRAELLNKLRIHPLQPAASLTDDERRTLWREMQKMMRQAVADGRIVTVDALSAAERATIHEQDARFVYKQARCRRCGAPVQISTIGGRTAYVCASCQTLRA